MVNKMVNVFKSYGINKGDVVCIYMLVSLLVVVVMLVCVRIGVFYR